MMAKGELVECGAGHGGLTVCPTCDGSGHVDPGEPGSPSWAKKAEGKSAGGHSHHQHCRTCQGSGLLQPHPLSCIG